MRRIILIVTTALLVTGGLLAVAAKPAGADDLTPVQAAHIKENCVAIKSGLSQLHASDALLRVNRGQVYESMASKLMETFNARLATNRLDSTAMVTATASYRNNLTRFRTNYITYETKLADTIRIDCASQPNTFHQSLLEARKLRQTVHDDVKNLHDSIDDYRSSVGGFLLNYKRLTN